MCWIEGVSGLPQILIAAQPDGTAIRKQIIEAITAPGSFLMTTDLGNLRY
jgi:hypothetical protein